LALTLAVLFALLEPVVCLPAGSGWNRQPVRSAHCCGISLEVAPPQSSHH